MSWKGKSNKESLVKDALSRKKAVEEPKENFKVSFEYFDSRQKYASSFRHWQEVGLLSKTLEVLQGYCRRPLLEQLDAAKFKSYGDFPHSDYTKFEKPAHVPPDACWARIHITGPAILVGHIVRDTFYLVFLDKTHKFWLTKRVREN